MDADSNVELTTDVVAQNEPELAQENNNTSRTSLDDALAKALEGAREHDIEDKPNSDAQEAGETEEVKPTEKQPEDILQPKQHWEASEKDIFSKLPDAESKKAFIDIRKKAEAEITKNAQARKEKEDIDRIWQPFSSMGTVQDGLNYYLGIERKMQADPKNTILGLAKMYNVDLGQSTMQPAMDNSDEEWVDPRVKQLEEKLSKFEERQANEERIKKAAENANIQAAIQNFTQTKDESGELKYPHFERLRSEMSRLLTAGISRTLEDAYEAAEKLDQELFSQRLELETKAKLQAEEKARKQEIKKAEVASRHLSGTGASRTAPRVKSLDDALAIALS